jgi:hypothetical protein
MKTKYDDFGQIVWQEPKRARRKKVTFNEVFKLLGEAIM